MTFSDWVSLSSPVCWIAAGCLFLNYAIRMKRRADLNPGKPPWLEMDEGKAERGYEAMRRAEADDVRADANLKRATEVWKESLAAFTPEQQEAMWQRIRSRIEPPPASLPFGSLSQPVWLDRPDASLNDFATWGRLSDFTGERE